MTVPAPDPLYPPPYASQYTTVAPIFLRDGASFERAVDLELTSPYGTWQQERSYRSKLDVNAWSPVTGQPFGPRWFGSEADRHIIEFTDQINRKILYVSAMAMRAFPQNGSNFDPPSDSYLKYETGNKIRDVVSGDVWVYNSNTTRGTKATYRTTRNGSGVWSDSFLYTYYTAGSLNGFLDRIDIPGLSQSIYYDYDETGGGDPLVKKVRVQEASTELMRADYSYKRTVTGEHADVGLDERSLIQVAVVVKATDGIADTRRVTQYRYTDSQSLKAVYEPDAIQRIIDTDPNINTPEDILTKPDSDVAQFASQSFTYYEDAGYDDPVDTAAVDTPFTTGTSTENLHRYANNAVNVDEDAKTVRVETVRSGSGSGCCGGGSDGVARHYFYFSQAAGADPSNDVVRVVVEDTVNSDGVAVYRSIYGLTERGRVVRQVLVTDPLTSPKYWCHSWTLEPNAEGTSKEGRIKEYRPPSAHSVTSDADVAILMSSTPYVWNANSGQVYVYQYNADGDRTAIKIKKGSNGTLYSLAGSTYVGGTDPDKKHLVSQTDDYSTKGGSAISTTYTYTYWPNSSQVSKVVRNFPAIPASQNGSGVSATAEEYYDSVGRLRWTKDAEGYITYYSYHPRNNELAYVVQDADPANLPTSATGNTSKWVDPSSGGADTNKPTREGSPFPIALSLVTQIEFDKQNRPVKRIDPSGAEHHVVYEANRTLYFPYWDGAKPRLPIEATVTDGGGQLTETYLVDPDQTVASGGKPTGLNGSTNRDHYISWTKYEYDSISGNVKRIERYHNIPPNGDPNDPPDVIAHFYETKYVYDALGRLTKLEQSVRDTPTLVYQITQQIYDSLDRVIEVKRTVAASGTNPTQRLSLSEYDSGGVGDGFVSRQVQYHNTGATDNTGVNYHRTYRGHVRGIEPIYSYQSGNPPTFSTQKPFTVHDIDWKGRPTSTAKYITNRDWTNSVLTGDGYTAYAETTATDRRTLARTSYDNLGRIFRTEDVAINQSSGAIGSVLRVDSYFDRNGRLVATQPAYSAANEYAYDSLGRRYQTRTVADLEATKYSSGKFQYRNPDPHPTLSSMTGGDQQLLAFTHQAFDAEGNTIESHTFEVNHNDSNGLSFAANDYVRRTVYSWHDGANRLTTVADFGSGHSEGLWTYAAVPSRPGSAPSLSSSEYLVTTYAYNADSGRLEAVLDPSARTRKFYYDDLGRTKYAVANAVNFDPTTEQFTGGGANADQDQVTKTEYDGLGSVVKLTAMDQNGNGNLSDNEVTQYFYEDAYNAVLLTKIQYPDSSGGGDVVTQTYYLDGLVKRKTDQLGTVTDYSYTNWRALEWDTITTVGTGVDGTVRYIRRQYDDLRRLDRVSSFNSGLTILNEIDYAYNFGFGQVTAEYQDHDGVASGSSPAVQYTYDDSADVNGIYDDGLRMTRVTYPSAKVVDRSFDTTFDDRLHRPTKLAGNHRTGTSEDLAKYKYNGISRLVETEYPLPGIVSRLDDSTSGDGTYENLDRFARIKTKLWKDGTILRDQSDYTYDFASNRLTRDIPSSLFPNPSTDDVRDQKYTYDGLNRLQTFDEGQLVSGSISSPKFEQDWTLDALGNWPTLVERTNGSQTLNQSRGHNLANEITQMAGSSQYVAHDAAGNMTKVPKPTNWSASYDLKYDAWNRLVEVKDTSSGNVLATYKYDGLHRRIVKTAGGNTYQYYYDTAWRCLEVRKGTETGTKEEQYVWSPYYIDALAVRYRDANLDGDYLDANETHCSLHDANFNVTALTDTTGAVIERYTYNPYGKLIVLNPDFSLDTDGSDFANPYTYTGCRLDSETGFYYYRYRNYHAQLGRFLARDPIGYLAGSNLYGAYFVPNGLDPFGLDVGFFDHIRYIGVSYVRYFTRPDEMDPGFQVVHEFAKDTAILAGTGAIVVASAGTAAPALGVSATQAEIAAFGGFLAEEAASAVTGVPVIIPNDPGDAVRVVRYGDELVDFSTDAARCIKRPCRPRKDVILRAATDRHHPLPNFLGGDIKQIYSLLDPKIHREFHKLLRENLREAGIPLNVGGRGGSAADWAQYMSTHPGAQSDAFDAVLDAARSIDAKYGTSITQDVWANIMGGHFTPYP